MPVREPLFKQRVLQNALRAERARGELVQQSAFAAMKHWATQLSRGVLRRLTESSAEQTFNSAIFGTVLGYEQVGTSDEASLMPKRTGPSGKDIPDFVLGRFDLAAGIDDWKVVGEIKNARTDLDQPQVGRKSKETPVEQAFRYAAKGKPGVDWIIVSNFIEIRLYKNGYTGSYHAWRLQELVDESKLFEFITVLKPASLLNRGQPTFTQRLFDDSIAVGRAITAGFYELYKLVQTELYDELARQNQSASLTEVELYGKTHKLLNRILFIAFCEQHPAGLLPRNTLGQLTTRARSKRGAGRYWNEYAELFGVLTEGGGIGGVAYNAFNGGLFAHDSFYDQIKLPDAMFEKRFHAGRGRSKSLEIVGIFGFDVYDFAEDLNVQALGAIFEQSLKDTIKGTALVRGVGETEVSSQSAGGVYYTPREITAYLVREALHITFQDMEVAARASVENAVLEGSAGMLRPTSEAGKEILVYDKISQSLKTQFSIIDPACGSGAFLVEALDQLHDRYEKINRTLAKLRGAALQLNMQDLDRQILRKNLYGRDLLPESIEISR